MRKIKPRHIFTKPGIQNTDIQGWFVIPIFLHYKWEEMHSLQRAINFLQDMSYESPCEVTKFFLKAIQTQRSDATVSRLIQRQTVSYSLWNDSFVAKRLKEN